MIDVENIHKEPAWKKQHHIDDYLEKTIILRCPYSMKAIKKKKSYYWCGSPLDEEFYPNKNPEKVKDKTIKQMLRVPVNTLTYHCFGNFWACKDHPGY